MAGTLRRMRAIMVKEFTQLRRDRTTFSMIIMIPVVQLLIFGYALNTDPKHMPTALLVRDHSVFSRSIVSALEESDYFSITGSVRSSDQGELLLRQGAVQFVVTVPEHFGRDLVRGQRPELLIEADATDPVAIGSALGAVDGAVDSALGRDLTGPLANLRQNPSPVDVRVHRLYNPEGFTRYNIVPGLIAIILTMTGIMMTALAMTRERERGTMETLLAMPVHPIEVMAGKILPYVAVGYVQSFFIIFVAEFLFDVPVLGSLWLLSAALVSFIACNLALGFTLSASAQNQTQVIQMSLMVTLPAIMLSGFLFPFRGMPEWAQVVGSAMPTTYFIRIARGILLKGNGLVEIWPDLWPLIAFMCLITFVSMTRYRRTLD
ncbi:MAG: ABC transporter permease [Alphaproteobacteria bacterium]|nr:ABC transporter permease [Alphaproteobacteria bacterium]MDE2337188.1 ABC transporter permease [Alphaproteobacteria bacterium]